MYDFIQSCEATVEEQWFYLNQLIDPDHISGPTNKLQELLVCACGVNLLRNITQENPPLLPIITVILS